jgi:hypothetical protein
VQTIAHSAFTFSIPRNRNWRNPFDLSEYRFDALRGEPVAIQSLRTCGQSKLSCLVSLVGASIISLDGFLVDADRLLRDDVPAKLALRAGAAAVGDPTPLRRVVEDMEDSGGEGGRIVPLNPRRRRRRGVPAAPPRAFRSPARRWPWQGSPGSRRSFPYRAGRRAAIADRG